MLAGNPPATGFYGLLVAKAEIYPGSTNEIQLEGPTFPLATFAAPRTFDGISTARVYANNTRESFLMASPYCGYGGTATVECTDGRGQVCIGTTYTFGATSLVTNNTPGAFLFGYAFSYYGDATVEATAQAFGSFVCGNLQASYTGNSGVIRSEGRGQFVSGNIQHYGAAVNGAVIEGNAGSGSFVQGNIDVDYGVAGSAAIQSGSGNGAFAQGDVQVTGASDAEITASGRGAFAGGSAANSDIIASGIGSFARGNAQGDAITASGRGAFAVGYTSSGAITASAENAVQFGPGVNALADSLQIGTSGIRLKGTVGAPGGGDIQNGDIWVAGGYLYRRSNGVSAQF